MVVKGYGGGEHEEKQRSRRLVQHWFIVLGFRIGNGDRHDMPQIDNRRYTCLSSGYTRHSHSQITGGFVMKVVTVESPKFLRGLLRLIFGIKKDDVTT